MKRAWYCRDLKGSLADYVYLYVGYNPPTMNDGKWEESEDYEWIPETEIEDVYGIDFMESLPNIDDGEMVEIRIKCTAEKCE
jgi:hypothetical protein